jgi:hypothetical protein
MKRIIIPSLFPVLFAAGMTTTHAQMTPSESQMNLQAVTGGNIFRTFDNRYRGVKGGVMLTETFLPGKVFMAQGQRFALDKMSYDAFNDELVVLRDNQEMAVTTTKVTGFVLNNGADTLHFDRVLRPDGKMGFFQRLNASGVIRLYKRSYKILREPDNKGAYNAGKDYAEFIPESKYFIQEKDQTFKEFKTKKSFLQLFPENKNALESFIKQEKIDFKRDEDLVRLIDYLSEIKG